MRRAAREVAGVSPARRCALAALCALSALSALSCGAASESPALKERREIAERVASNVQARARGDGVAACAAYTPALRRAFERSGGEPGACERASRAAASELTARVDPDDRTELVMELGQSDRIVVERRGGRATAEYDPPPAGISPPPVALERVGGRWLISALDVPAAPADPL